MTRVQKIKLYVVGSIVGIIALIILAMAMLHRADCQWYGYQTERTVRYAFAVGCMVKMPTGWTPRSEIRTEQ